MLAAVASSLLRGRFSCHFDADPWPGRATNSGGFVGLQWHSICSAGEATEVFAVARAQVEEGGDGLAVGRLPAFQLEGVDGGEVRGMDLVVGGDVVFGYTGRAPSAGAEAGAGTPSPSGHRGRRMLGRVRAGNGSLSLLFMNNRAFSRKPAGRLGVIKRQSRHGFGHLNRQFQATELGTRSSTPA